MPQEIVTLLTLREAVDPAEYERWVREVDYPVTRRQRGVLSYSVTRLDEATDGGGAVPGQYLEVIRVADLEEYRRASAADPEFRAMMAAWETFVAHFTASVGLPVE